MLPDIHTSSIRDNQTGAEGMITQRQIYRRKAYESGKSYEEIFGKLNKATVVHLTPLDSYSFPDRLLTLEQYHELPEHEI